MVDPVGVNAAQCLRLDKAEDPYLRCVVLHQRQVLDKAYRNATDHIVLPSVNDIIFSAFSLCPWNRLRWHLQSSDTGCGPEFSLLDALFPIFVLTVDIFKSLNPSVVPFNDHSHEMALLKEMH